jgi:hypothetical protein
MMRTVISHFYNEEYLLPWWLNHHKDIFDNGILINYGSTDNSVNIIKSICPNWTVLNSNYTEFDARNCDLEVSAIEKELVDGYRIALNITEFIIGNIESMNVEQQYLIPVYPMIDSIEDEFKEPDINIPLVKQRFNGININRGADFFNIRKSRSYHLKNINYPVGRHFNTFNVNDVYILWYGYSPFTDKLIDRKLQIQNKISNRDKTEQRGREHLIDRKQLLINFRSMQQHAEDLTTILK